MMTKKGLLIVSFLCFTLSFSFYFFSIKTPNYLSGEEMKMISAAGCSQCLPDGGEACDEKATWNCFFNEHGTCMSDDGYTGEHCKTGDCAQETYSCQTTSSGNCMNLTWPCSGTFDVIFCEEIIYEQQEYCMCTDILTTQNCSNIAEKPHCGNVG